MASRTGCGIKKLVATFMAVLQLAGHRARGKYSLEMYEDNELKVRLCSGTLQQDDDAGGCCLVLGKVLR